MVKVPKAPPASYVDPDRDRLGNDQNFGERPAAHGNPRALAQARPLPPRPRQAAGTGNIR